MSTRSQGSTHHITSDKDTIKAKTKVIYKMKENISFLTKRFLTWKSLHAASKKMRPHSDSFHSFHSFLHVLFKGPLQSINIQNLHQNISLTFLPDQSWPCWTRQFMRKKMVTNSQDTWVVVEVAMAPAKSLELLEWEFCSSTLYRMKTTTDTIFIQEYFPQKLSLCQNCYLEGQNYNQC
jgi:hypothetical protein